MKNWNDEIERIDWFMEFGRLNNANFHSTNGQKNHVTSKQSVRNCKEWKCVCDQWWCWSFKKFW